MERSASQPSFLENKGRISLTYRDSGSYGGFLNACRMKAYRTALARHAVDTARVVDVGCSYGSWAANWRSLGFRELVGVDPNEAVLEDAGKVFDEVHHGQAGELPFADGSCGFIASNGVLVHVLEDVEKRRFLAGVARCLRADGLFAFSIVNARTYEPAQGVEGDTDTASYRFPSTHVALAQQAGLRVIDQIGTFVDPYGVPAVRRFGARRDLRQRAWALRAAGWYSSACRRFANPSRFHELLFVAVKS